MKLLPYISIDMNQDFIGEKSQSGVKGKIVGVKKITSSKIKKLDIEEKEYYCFTCEFATNNRKDYKRQNRANF